MTHRRFLGALCVAIVFGCDANGNGDDATPTDVGAVTQSLELEVSEPFEVERFPDTFTDVARDMPAVSCGDSVCFLTYEYRPVGALRFGHYVVRVAPDGTLLDDPHPVLGWGSVEAQMVIGDDLILVFRGSGQPRTVVRVDGNDGTLSDGPPALLTPGRLQALVPNGATALATYADFGNYAQLFDSSTWEPIGTPVVLPWIPRDVAAGPDQYLLTGEGAFMRIDGSSGAALDPTPVDLSSYVEVNWVDAAYHTGTYQLVWQVGNGIWGARVRASDGALLDPDDDFNQIAGPQRICGVCTRVNNISGRIALDVVGGEVVLFWTALDGNVVLRATRIDVATGLPVVGVNQLIEYELGEFAYDFQFAAGGAMAVAANAQQVRTISVQTMPLVLTPDSLAPYAFRSGRRESPSVASDGTNFLVAYRIDNSVAAIRIDGTTGAYIDASPLQLGTGSLVAAASDGTDYLVAWMTPLQTIERRWIRADGTVEPVMIPAVEIMSGGDPAETETGTFGLVFNGKYFLLSWYRDAPFASRTLGAQRLDADGAIVGPRAALDVVAGYPLTVVADTTPEPEMRTFTAVYNYDRGLGVRRYRSESGVVVDPVTTIDPDGTLSVATTDGTDVIVFYRANRNRDQAVSLVNPVTGENAPGYPVNFGEIRDYRVIHTWFDGRSIMTLWRGPNDDYFVHRYDADLGSLDSALPVPGLPVTGETTEHQMVTAASNGDGRSLLVHQAQSFERHGLHLLARFLDNDSEPAPMPAAPDAAVPPDAAVATDAGTPPDTPTGTGGQGGGDTPDPMTTDAGGVPPGEGGEDSGGQQDDQTAGGGGADGGDGGCSCRIADAGRPRSPLGGLASGICILMLLGRRLPRRSRRGNPTNALCATPVKLQ